MASLGGGGNLGEEAAGVENVPASSTTGQGGLSTGQSSGTPDRTASPAPGSGAGKAQATLPGARAVRPGGVSRAQVAASRPGVQAQPARMASRKPSAPSGATPRISAKVRTPVQAMKSANEPPAAEPASLERLNEAAVSFPQAEPSLSGTSTVVPTSYREGQASTADLRAVDAEQIPVAAPFEEAGAEMHAAGKTVAQGQDGEQRGSATVQAISVQAQAAHGDGSAEGETASVAELESPTVSESGLALGGGAKPTSEKAVTSTDTATRTNRVAPAEDRGGTNQALAMPAQLASRPGRLSTAAVPEQGGTPMKDEVNAAVLPPRSATPGSPRPENGPLESPGRRGAGAASATETQQGTRGPKAAALTEHRAAPVAAQPAGFTADSGGLERNPVGTQAPACVPEGARAVSATPRPSEAFAALDTDVTPGAPTWTQAGARQAEAGFKDPALGWVGVRAEMSGGAVHAAVVPGSVEASHELGRHMDALHAYLAEQHTPVQSLAMAGPSGRSANAPGDEGLNRHMNQNTRQGQGEDPQHQASTGADAGPVPRGAGIGSLSAVESAVLAVGLQGGTEPGLGEGLHISVMA